MRDIGVPTVEWTHGGSVFKVGRNWTLSRWSGPSVTLGSKLNLDDFNGYEDTWLAVVESEEGPDQWWMVQTPRRRVWTVGPIPFRGGNE